jgi:hypothetical protein
MKGSGSATGGREAAQKMAPNSAKDGVEQRYRQVYKSRKSKNDITSLRFP